MGKAVAGHKKKYVSSSGGMVSALWDKALEAGLSQEELSWYQGAGEQAVGNIGALARVLEGLACYVAADGEPSGNRIGSFAEPCDVSGLLFMLSDQLDVSHALLRVSFDAGNRLEAERVQVRAKAA